MPPKLQLVGKGPVKSFKRAAARHGISARGCIIKGPNTVICDTSCDARKKVVQWHGERSPYKRGRGHLPGTLLFYGGCPAGGLGGARRRRKR